MFGQMFTKSDNVLKSYLTHECDCDICDNIDTCSNDFWAENGKQKSRFYLYKNFLLCWFAKKKKCFNAWALKSVNVLYVDFSVITRSRQHKRHRLTVLDPEIWFPIEIIISEPRARYFDWRDVWPLFCNTKIPPRSWPFLGEDAS